MQRLKFRDHSKLTNHIETSKSVSSYLYCEIVNLFVIEGVDNCGMSRKMYENFRYFKLSLGQI